MLADENVRLPGERRHKSVAAARKGRMEIFNALLKHLREFAD